MHQVEVSSSVVQEQQEVELVLEKFARSPRLTKLLAYICKNYFDGTADRLSELTIAVEVFDRSVDFDRSQDAIARVEAHRLRKKLKEFYETEGKDHRVQISLQPGSYVPLFHHLSAIPNGNTPELTVDEPSADQPLDERPETKPMALAQLTPLQFDNELTSKSGEPRKRIWLYLTAAFVAVIAVGSYAVFRGQSKPAAARTAPAAKVPSVAPLPAVGIAPQDTVRILCGYDGPPHIGPLGEKWGKDRYFEGGRPEPSTHSFTARSSDPFLFERMRTGEFNYEIPLKPGVYELHLYFIETGYGDEMGGGENSRTFLIRLNDRVLFGSFDIFGDAMGARIADERVIRDVEPGKDGKLRLSFESQRGQPIISAIEVVPGIPHKQLPIRIVTQTGSFTDHLGQIWSPDNYYEGGEMSMRRSPVSGTPDPGLYASERYGNFTYAIPVDPRGTYSLTLHMAETYFGQNVSGQGGPGSRVFDVMANGVLLVKDLDISKEVGSLHALTETFHGLKPTAQGKLVLWFNPVVNYASVFALEVLDESK
jgi:Malectin domain